MTARSDVTHRMIPGSHERDGGAECVCGAQWNYWRDECTSGEVAA